MKRVYRSDLLTDEDIIEFLQDMNDQGYKLVKKNIFWVFEETDKKLKYQIDYNTPGKEYQEVLHELGYELICHNDYIKIYVNEDPNADDLISDYDYFNKKKVKSNLGLIVYVLLIYFLYLMFKMLIESLNFNLGDFYLNTANYFVALYMIPVMIYFILSILEKYIRNSYYKGKMKYIKYYKTITKTNDIVMISMAVISLIYFILLHYTVFDISVAILGICITCWFAYGDIGGKLVKGPLKKEKKQSWIREILILAFIILINVYNPFEILDNYMKTYDYFSNDFPVLAGKSYERTQNIFLKDQSYNVYDIDIDGDYSMYDSFILCKTEGIANEIFKEKIITLQQLHTTMISYDDYIENWDEDEYWSGDEPYLSYKEALKEYKKINDYYIIENYDYYYDEEIDDFIKEIDDYIVVYRYEKLVICLVTKDIKDIDDTLNQLVEYYNQ